MDHLFHIKIGCYTYDNTKNGLLLFTLIITPNVVKFFYLKTLYVESIPITCLCAISGVGVWVKTIEERSNNTSDELLSCKGYCNIHEFVNILGAGKENNGACLLSF